MKKEDHLSQVILFLCSNQIFNLKNSNINNMDILIELFQKADQLLGNPPFAA
jgi:hypothetical protein